MTKLIPDFLLILVSSVFFCVTAGNRGDDSLRSIIQKEKNDTIKINLLNQLANSLLMKNPDSGLFLSQQAITLSQQKKFYSGLANGYENAGLCFAQKGDYKSAYDFYVKAINSHEILGSKTGLASCFCNLGDLFLDQSEYAQAMNYFLKALKINNQILDKVNISKILGNMGITYFYQGEFPKALNYYYQAMKINKELVEKAMLEGNTSKINKYKNLMAKSYSNIGIIHYEQDEFQKALEYFYKALKLKEEIGDKYGIAGNLWNLGNLYSDNNEFEKALENYTRALRISEEIGDKMGMASNLGNIASIYQKQNQVEKMLEYYQMSLKMQEEIGDKNGVCVNFGRLGTYYMNAGQFNLAEKYLKRAFSLSDSIGTLGNTRITAERLSNLYLSYGQKEYKTGNFKSSADQFLLSLEYIKRAFSAKDSLINQDKSKEIGRLEAKHEIEIKELERKRAETEQLRKSEEQTERRNLLQYSGIFIFILALGLTALFTGKLRVSMKLTEGIIFFMFLLFFEFILVLLDPYSDRITQGIPIYKLLFNAIIAAFIFPAHAYLEKIIIKRIHGG
ncbi:MAG: hypothetical protein A3H98_13885 [Bacteroidetes bacterium RIFCSPLOWO2_02_FULL_36_8]|nr:MAG: hypothetical protein A3H98_13885 [Bacteroidetes bacterium RIFCSPLOWO2_02_FULL_36_8]OFY70987.1 MAG: hypothetical protein A3G23_12795 [Bacteroidetes bacterium RIFCSPLOWO2_12_FULL_37_12]